MFIHHHHNITIRVEELSVFRSRLVCSLILDHMQSVCDVKLLLWSLTGHWVILPMATVLCYIIPSNNVLCSHTL